MGGCLNKGRTAAACQAPGQLPSPHLLENMVGVDLTKHTVSAQTISAAITPASVQQASRHLPNMNMVNWGWSEAREAKPFPHFFMF